MPVKQKSLNVKVERIESILGYHEARVTITRPEYDIKCSFYYNPNTFQHTLNNAIGNLGFSRTDLDTVRTKIDQIIEDTPLLLNSYFTEFNCYELTA